MTTIKNLAFVTSDMPEAKLAARHFAKIYGEVPPEQADVIVALGGDGLMLQTLHGFMGQGKPIYGINRGSVGFLMNEYRELDLLERINSAERSIIHPLLMQATDHEGHICEARAINEVSIFRQSYQAAKLSLSVDGRVRMPELVADGVLSLGIPGGSTGWPRLSLTAAGREVVFAPDDAPDSPDLG